MFKIYIYPTVWWKTRIVYININNRTMLCNTDSYMYKSIILHYWQCHMNVSSYQYKWYLCTKTVILSHSVLASVMQERHWHKPTHQKTFQIAQGWSTECKLEVEKVWLLQSGEKKKGERYAWDLMGKYKESTDQTWRSVIEEQNAMETDC